MLDVGSHAPLFQPVSVHTGDCPLVQLPAQRAAGGFLNGLVGVVQRLNHKGERGLLRHGHLLDGVSQVLGRAEAVISRVPVIGLLGYGVHRVDTNRLCAHKGIVVAARGVCDGRLVKSLCDFVSILDGIIDCHIDPLFRICGKGAVVQESNPLRKSSLLLPSSPADFMLPVERSAFFWFFCAASAAC